MTPRSRPFFSVNFEASSKAPSTHAHILLVSGRDHVMEQIIIGLYNQNSETCLRTRDTKTPMQVGSSR